MKALSYTLMIIGFVLNINGNELDEPNILFKGNNQFPDYFNNTMYMNDIVRITFRMNQSNVYIRLDEKTPVLSLDNTAIFILPKGDHRFSFTKQGFDEIFFTLNIQQHQLYEIELIPGTSSTPIGPTGCFTINSLPEGAEVFLNSQLVGLTPYKGEHLYGSYKVDIRHFLHYEHQEQLKITDGADIETPLIKMRPRYGHLIIKSDPVGATVYIEEWPVGITPYDNPEHPSGTYSIRLEKPLFAEVNDNVVISDGKKTERFIDLTDNFGRLEVSATGSEIFLNGQFIGRDSYRADLSPGIYRVKADEEEREIMISVGQTESLIFTAAPRPGILLIESDPPESQGAEIFINGQIQRQTTPAEIQVPPGKYNVTIRKTGFREEYKSVEVIEDREHRLAFIMHPVSDFRISQINRHRNSKIAYGIGAMVSAGAGTYFLLSSFKLAEDYKSATTDATDIFNRMEQHQLISYVALGATVPLTIMTVVKSSHQNRAERILSVSAYPLQGGATFGLRYKF